MGKEIKEILIKDNVKYESIRPEPEPTNFEPMIKEHVEDIFGPGCIYFAKREMKSLADSRSISDGFVIDFEKEKWYIVELKLLGDDAIRRIAGQIVDYKNAIKNSRALNDIRTAILEGVDDFDYREDAKVKHYCKDISRFLDLIYNKTPKITVIIDNIGGKDGRKMEEKIRGADENAKIIEFKTFVREGTEYECEQEHIHLFKPLYEIKPIKTEGIGPIGPEHGEKEIPIFVRHNKKDYEAILIDSKKVKYNGVIYQSPTAACRAVTGWPTCPGPTFWKYKDKKDGKVKNIKENELYLRKSKGVKGPKKVKKPEAGRKRITPKDYWLPILETLMETRDGKGKADDVKKRVFEEKMKGKLTSADLDKVSWPGKPKYRPLKWRSDIENAIERMTKKKKWVKKPSYGILEITDEGRKHYDENK